ncbi:MAG: prepilin-type N-terminal cleavage/methylation domain-containing protein [Planctomycetes bacterium]|nr:prepilin-type N-terminal cleavage/methylation domain-containing protein [Planctomycetota bacterium]
MVGNARTSRVSRRTVAGLRQRGTTLIELLVVFGIIGVLISMLIPSLQRSMRLAASTVCMHNLKVIGDGLFMYRMDNDGWVPTSLAEPPEASVTASAHREAWFVRLFPTYLAEAKVMTCPRDPFRFRLLEAPGGVKDPRAGDLASYGLNSFILNAAGGKLADLDRHRPVRPLDTILVADLGPDSLRDVRGGIARNGPRRKESLLSWDDGYNPVSMHMAAPWVTRRHSHGINVLTLAGGVRHAQTDDVMRNPVKTHYPDCAAGGCSLCNNSDPARPLILHYSFARDRLYWWTGQILRD